MIEDCDVTMVMISEDNMHKLQTIQNPECRIVFNRDSNVNVDVNWGG